MRAIFFDLDGTLLRFTRAYREVLADAFRDVRGEVRDGWLDVYDEAFYELFERCEPDPVCRAFSQVAGGSDADELAAALREREIEACRPPEGAEVHLARLSEGYAIGVLTNGVRDWQERKLEAAGLDRYVDAFVASYEVGAHKPATAPFRTAEDRLPADAYAMVGDDAVDIEGARNAGWTAHRYAGDGFGDLPDALGWE